MDVILSLKLIFFWMFGFVCIFDFVLGMLYDIDFVFLNDGC